MYIIPLEKVKQITKATTDEQAGLQLSAAVKLIEDYLGLVLFKTDFTDEKITIPYESMRIIRPAKKPINSVKEIKYYDWHKCEYRKLEHNRYVIGNESLEFKELRDLRHNGIAKVLLSYNAGLYDNLSQVPSILIFVIEKVLNYLFVSGNIGGGFQSEHLGDYSYSKAALVNGLPADIAGLLQGLNL